MNIFILEDQDYKYEAVQRCISEKYGDEIKITRGVNII